MQSALMTFQPFKGKQQSPVAIAISAHFPLTFLRSNLLNVELYKCDLRHHTWSQQLDPISEHVLNLLPDGEPVADLISVQHTDIALVGQLESV